MQRLDGKILSEKLRAKLREGVEQLQAEYGFVPGLAVVLLGEDPASQVYVRNKGRQCVEAGMQSFEHVLPASVTQKDLLELISKLNADDQVDGILVQLPLPSHLDSNTVLQAIDPDKDVDGFHPMNVGKLASGLPGYVPCTPLGCLKLLQHYIGDVKGKYAVVVGRSNIVGKPMAQLLLQQDCTVTIAHSKTRNLPELCQSADILVAAIGKPLFIKGDWIKPGAIVLDVGINRITDTDGKHKLVGDVDFQAASAHASAVTPVPGGIGPMTIACLLLNTFQAAINRRGLAA